MSDVVHLILCIGETLDWARLVERTGENWPLLLAQLLTFNYVYPGYRATCRQWVFETLLERARTEDGADEASRDLTRGPSDLAIQLFDRRQGVGLRGSDAWR